MNHRDLKYGVTEFDLTQVQAVDHTTNRQWFITSVHNHLENLGIGDLLTRIFSHLLWSMGSYDPPNRDLTNES